MFNRYIRSFAISLVFCLLFSVNTSAFMAGNDNTYFTVEGDVNGDNHANAKDALEVLKICARLQIPNYWTTALADMDYDGKLSAKDALVILKISAGVKLDDYYSSASGLVVEKKYSEEEIKKLIEYVENNLSIEEATGIDMLAVCCLFNDNNTPELVLVDEEESIMKIIYEINGNVYEKDYSTAWRNDYLYLPATALFGECAGMVKPHLVEEGIEETIYSIYVK